MEASYLKDLVNEVAHYSECYRHPDFPSLNLSNLYDLFPPNKDGLEDMCWPAFWPSGDSPGVYAILDEKHKLIYIGKASMGSSISRRLCTYFINDENRNCKVKNPSWWKGSPRYITVIPMTKELKFEAPALEEYLIHKLHSTSNVTGS
jgi:hypothetical protein